MKKYIFGVLFSMVTLILWGQGVRQYNFFNTLAEKNGHTPTLTMLDSVGSFVIDTIKELNNMTRIVYRFKKDAGVQFDNTIAGNFFGQTYSIELYFVFDETGGYKRVIDWKNRTTDYGCYMNSGYLSFYPYAQSDSIYEQAGQYFYFVLTRDSASMHVKIYGNAVLGIDYTDTFLDAVLNSANVLNFFTDDLSVPNEASPGAVAMMNIYNYVLDPSTILANYNNLQGEILSVHNMKQQGNISVYPNPAHNNLVIDLKTLNPQGTVMVSLIDMTGAVVYSNRYIAGRLINLDLNPDEFPSGIYMVKMETDTGVYSIKIVIRQ